MLKKKEENIYFLVVDLYTLLSDPYWYAYITWVLLIAAIDPPRQKGMLDFCQPP